ncbi:hypothetical protein VTO73DRAFT_7156 [Trametes versicolor]
MIPVILAWDYIHDGFTLSFPTTLNAYISVSFVCTHGTADATATRSAAIPSSSRATGTASAQVLTRRLAGGPRRMLMLDRNVLYGHRRADSDTLGQPLAVAHPPARPPDSAPRPGHHFARTTRTPPARAIPELAHTISRRVALVCCVQTPIDSLAAPPYEGAARRAKSAGTCPGRGVGSASRREGSTE